MISVGTIKTAKEKLLSLVTSMRKKDNTHDSLFEQLVDDTLSLMEEYAKNPLDMMLVEKAEELVEGFDALNPEKCTSDKYDRSKVNSAVVSSRIRRTHYAAYLAGKHGTSDQIGAKYKAWMHNAAANGALALYEAIRLCVEEIPDSQSAELVLAFGSAAKHDALQLLYLADDFDETSVLTRYNRAKLDVLSKNPPSVRLGIDALRSIEPPDDESHPADLSWHKDNFSCFNTSDMYLHDLIGVEDGNKLELVKATLERNAKRAQEIIDDRSSNLWHKERTQNRAILVGCLVGTAVAGTAFLSPDVREFLMSALTSVNEILLGSLANGDTPVLAWGDGGIAAQQLLGVAFGDGGMPRKIASPPPIDVAVRPRIDQAGIGREIVNAILPVLRSAGIVRCNQFSRESGPSSRSSSRSQVPPKWADGRTFQMSSNCDTT